MRAFAEALDAIPMALAENSGLSPIESLASIKSRQVTEKNSRLGVDCMQTGSNGEFSPRQHSCIFHLSWHLARLLRHCQLSLARMCRQNRLLLSAPIAKSASAWRMRLCGESRLLGLRTEHIPAPSTPPQLRVERRDLRPHVGDPRAWESCRSQIPATPVACDTRGPQSSSEHVYCTVIGRPTVKPSQIPRNIY
jgi:hypothetical protein